MSLTAIDVDANLTVQSGIIWKDQRLEYSGSNLVYKGCHLEYNAATSDTNWYITKYTYTAGDITRIGLVKGPWDDRATLF